MLNIPPFVAKNKLMNQSTNISSISGPHMWHYPRWSPRPAPWRSSHCGCQQAPKCPTSDLTRAPGPTNPILNQAFVWVAFKKGSDTCHRDMRCHILSHNPFLDELRWVWDNSVSGNPFKSCEEATDGFGRGFVVTRDHNHADASHTAGLPEAHQ